MPLVGQFLAVPNHPTRKLHSNLLMRTVGETIEQLATRTYHEVRLMHRATSQSCTILYGLHSTPNVSQLYIEYYDLTLDKLIETAGPLKELQPLQAYSYKLLGATSYLHRQLIVFRDLSPAKIAVLLHSRHDQATYSTRGRLVMFDFSTDTFIIGCM